MKQVHLSREIWKQTAVILEEESPLTKEDEWCLQAVEHYIRQQIAFHGPGGNSPAAKAQETNTHPVLLGNAVAYCKFKAEQEREILIPFNWDGFLEVITLVLTNELGKPD